MSSGIENQILNPGKNNLTDNDRKLMDSIAKISYKAYKDFKAHPSFVPYLQHMSTLPYYAKANIGSRPSKRGKSGTFKFEDLNKYHL